MMTKPNDTFVTEETIQKVQKGSLQMSPAKAIALAGELFGRGRYKQAERVCRQIIQSKPSTSDAHNILGVALNAQGQSVDAIASIKKAIKLAPNVSSYYANLGEIQRTSGYLPAAQKTLEQGIRVDPKNAQAYNNLGIVHYENKDYDKAIEAYRKALEITPEFPEARNNLGNSLRMAGDLDGAGKAYQGALTLREIYPEAYNNLGTLLREQKNPDAAQHALRKAIQQNPRYVDAYNNLASILHFENKDVEALRQMTDVLRFAPRNPKSLLLTARIQLKRANYDAVEKACKIVLEDDPSSSEAMAMLGQLMHELDRYDEAITYLEKALELNPDNAEARNFYGVTLKSVGRLDDARKQIMAAIDLNVDMYGAYSNLNDLVDFSKEPVLFNRIEALMEADDDQGSDRILPLHYAYAKALDDVGQHEKALEHYMAGGRIKRAQLNYVEQDTFAFFEKIKKQFPAQIFKSRPFEGNPSDRLVFILGMPRSGSTLTEQIISSHPDVFGAGEVKYLSRSVHSLKDRFPSLTSYPALVDELDKDQFDILAKKYLSAMEAPAGAEAKLTDKLLTNYFFVGLINILFPKAKIINTVRNPVDTCLSAFTKLFKDDMPHSYDLSELGRYYCEYEKLMEHWEKVLPAGVMKRVSYEDMVEDTEGTAREVIEFIGLPWNDTCLDFHNSSRAIKTASVAQVRKPIYNSAIERWRKYGEGLRPLLGALGREDEMATVRENAPD
jgi:tetratricopeptide (TPR) repeat protein